MSGRWTVRLVVALGVSRLVMPPIAADATSTTASSRVLHQVATARAITVTPHDELVSGQSVTLAGSGFSPHASIGASECAGDRETDVIECSDPVQFPADATGRFSIRFVVQRKIGGIDCLKPSVLCQIAVAESGNPDGFPQTAVITFSPNSK